MYWASQSWDHWRSKSPPLHWKTRLTYTQLNRWCRRDLRKCIICTCCLVVMVATGGTDLLGLHAGKFFIVHVDWHHTLWMWRNICGVTVDEDRGWIVARAAWLEIEVFGTGESSERRWSEECREQHGLQRRALMYLRELKVRDTYRHLGRGQNLTIIVINATLIRNILHFISWFLCYYLSQIWIVIDHTGSESSLKALTTDE